MAISFKCRCGAALTVADGTGGRETLCTSCRGLVRIPGEEGVRSGRRREAKVRAAASKAAPETPVGPPASSPSAGEAGRANGPTTASRPEGTGEVGQEAGPPEASAAPARRKDARESPVDLFREAIAVLGGAPLPASSPGDLEEDGEETSDTLVLAGEEAGMPPSSPHSGSSAAPSGRGDDRDAEDVEDAESVEFRPAASDLPGNVDVGEDAPEAPRKGNAPSGGRALSPEAAAEAVERRNLDRALRREGEGESPAGAYEPVDFQVVGQVVKFHCRCGKRVSAPLDSKKAVGHCPKCGGRLVLPRPGAASPKGRTSSDDADVGTSADRKDGDEGRSGRARLAVAEAADRMRRAGARDRGTQAPSPRRGRTSGATSASGAGPRTAPWVNRMIAFHVDAALVVASLFAAAFAVSAPEGSPINWPAAAALAAAVWVSNRILALAVTGASLGMWVARLTLLGTDGRMASFRATALRAVLGAALLPLAPLALRDPGGRTLADRLAGTVVLQVGP